MSKAIGIDLGTTHSVAAVKRLKAEIIPNSQGDLLTPSVVACQTEKGSFGKKEKFLVGRQALDWMAQDPENTVLSVKRLMGRSFNDKEISKLIQEKRFSYTIRGLTGGSKHSLAIVLNHEEYTPEQISARILEKIKADAERGLKEDADHAVVTVPAYFNDKQKNATRMAAALAGIKVQRLLSEPTAAAISFGIDAMAEGEGQTILVFDLGGGTFDIAILTIADGQFIEQGKGGDMWMGGDDIDALITRYVLSETEKTQGIDNLPKRVEALPTADRNRFLSDLKGKVEAAKIHLSTHKKAVIEILGLLTDEDGDILDVEVELTRSQFETLLLPFAERTVELTREMIEAIDFDLALIDKIVMVGGASSIPLVIHKMQEAFGEKRVLTHPRPMLAIAEGAAILAHRLSDSYECPGCGKTVAQADAACGACAFDLNANLAKTGIVDIVYTVSHDYTLALEDGSAYLLVEKNTPLPFKTEASFKLMHSEQRLAHFKFHNRVNDIQESIGDLWLSFDPDEHEADASGHDPKDAVREILLTFEVDENNIITVAASLKDLPDVKVSKTLSRGNIDEKLFMDLEASITQVNREKHDYYVVLDFLQRTIGIAKEINQVLDPKTGEIDETIRKQVKDRQSVTQQLLAKESSAFSNLYYAESFMSEVGIFLSDAEQRAIQKKIDKLKEKNTSGSMDDILKARDALLKALDKHPLLSQIKNIESAAEILLETSPTKAFRLLKYLDDIKSALMHTEKETFLRLMNEIMPEVHQVLDGYESKDLRIWKGIRR